MAERITYNVKIDQKLKLERLAIEASVKIGRSVKWTELMETLIQELAKDAQEIIIHREQKTNKTA